MSVQRMVSPTGSVRWKARVKVNGIQVAAKRFDRKADALEWERDQAQRLKRGDWVDPRRGKVTLTFVSEGWLLGRAGVKRRTRETDEQNWRVHIQPRFGKRIISSITTAEVTEWAAQLVASGKAPSTARRALSTFRSVLAHAVADERLVRNVAQTATVPRGVARREGIGLDLIEVATLRAKCKTQYAEIVTVLAHTGLRWGELAGLQVGDRIAVPGDGLRIQRAVLSSGGSGELFVDSLKTNRARTIPLTAEAAEIVTRWAGDREPHEWLFPTVTGTALREGNWKRTVGWITAKKAIGRPTLRVHDLRHTAASLWLASGADPKVVQRMLGHASATMTMDLYGHLIDSNLWEGARRFGDQLGTKTPESIEEKHA